MSFTARRFPDTITRRRFPGTGSFNSFDEYVPDPPVERDLRASVQPLLLEDADTAAGVRYSNRFKVYVPEPDALAAAFEESVADKVVYDGMEYVVTESASWSGSHTQAVILRET